MTDTSNYMQQPMFMPQQMPAPSYAPQSNLQPQDLQHVNDVMNQYIQSKQSQQNGGLLQQILSNRMQPQDQDIMSAGVREAQSYASPGGFKPYTPEGQMADRITQQLSPYSDALKLAQQGETLSGDQMQNRVYAETGLPTAQANLLQLQQQNNIRGQTGLPLSQAALENAQITNRFLPQTLQSENALRGAQIPGLIAETAGRNITNQYLPQSLQAEIDAKKAQAALAMGSNIFASPMGGNAGFGAANGNTPFPSGGMSTPNGEVAPANNQQGQAAPTNGYAFLQRLTPQAAAQVKALAEGRMAFPSGFALKTPYWQNMLSAVSQYDPNFDAVNFNSRLATRKSFTSGPDANNIAALNTAMSHLSTLQDAYQTLDNSDVPYYNQAINFVGNAVGNKTIQTNTANVSADSEAVSHELAKVFRSTGMSEGEIDAWKNKISTSAGPAQSTALINSALNLMDGRLQALGAKYNQGMGTTTDPIQLLSPEAQTAYTKLRSAGTQGQKIKVSSPDGTVGTIDPSELQDALKNGWKQVQ